MSLKELTNEDLQALKTFKYIMNKKDEIKDEEYAKLIGDVFLTSLNKVCTMLKAPNSAKSEDLMKIISVLDDDVCQLYGNDPTGLKVLEKLKSDYTLDKVGAAAGEILNAYNILSKTASIAKAGASFCNSLSGFLDAANELQKGEINYSILSQRVNTAAESFFGAVKGIVSFIPVVGTIATSIVDGLNWCYDQLFSFTSSRIKLLEEQTALCDYMSGQISKASFLSTIRNCVGDEKYFEYLEYFNAFQKAQDDLESKHGSSSATAIKTSIRDWSIARVIDLISSMSDDEKKDSDIQAIIQKYSLSISKSIGGTYVDPKEIDTITAIMGGVVDDANSATTKVVDPLAFDLKGDGFRLLSVLNGVYFDMDKNGTREKVGWIGGDDAFLAYDRNGDGIINDSGELFGDNTILKDGTKASTGFEALMEWDDNGDGVIDENDEIFSHLLVWRDIDEDGISDFGELVTLSEAGIKAIRLDFTTQNITDSSGSILTRTATFIMDDDTESVIGEFNFEQIRYDTNDDNINVEISDDILALPNVRSFGNALSLHKAMALDTTGKLKELVESFCVEEDSDRQREILTDIIYFLSKADSIDPNSRGGNFDARKLASLECMLGERYVGVQGSSNPNSLAAVELQKAFDNLINLYYVQLLPYTSLSDYIQLISYTNEGKNEFNLDFLNTYIDFKLVSDKPMGERLLKNFAIYFYYVEKAGIKCFDAFREYFRKESTDLAMLIDTAANIAVLGTDANDSMFVSSGKTSLYGLGGNDNLYGGNMDDVLDGGAGNDYLSGGAGNDTYIFGPGYGTDTVYDGGRSNSDVDRIKFLEGIRPEAVKMRKVNSYNLEIYFDGLEDKIVVQNYFYYGKNDPEYKIEEIEFANGTVWDKSDIEACIGRVYGTEANEVLNVVYSDQNNELHGLGGNDNLYGGNSDDVLDGGAGNDYLSGGAGNDTYIFGIGHGKDTIYDTGGNDRIQISEEAENLIFSRSGNNLLINELGKEDSITVQNWYSGSNNQIETIATDSGAYITNTQVEQLIQAMASFTSENNISWDDAISQNPSDISNIMEQFWVR